MNLNHFHPFLEGSCRNSLNEFPVEEIGFHPSEFLRAPSLLCKVEFFQGHRRLLTTGLLYQSLGCEADIVVSVS